MDMQWGGTARSRPTPRQRQAVANVRLTPAPLQASWFWPVSFIAIVPPDAGTAVRPAGTARLIAFGCTSTKSSTEQPTAGVTPSLLTEARVTLIALTYWVPFAGFRIVKSSACGLPPGVRPRTEPDCSMITGVSAPVVAAP